MMQCQSLIEELSASCSTDLQQRAYELQVVIGLDSHTVENIMPLDASCEDIEVILNIVTVTLLWLPFIFSGHWLLMSSYLLLICRSIYFLCLAWEKIDMDF